MKHLALIIRLGTGILLLVLYLESCKVVDKSIETTTGSKGTTTTSNETTTNQKDSIILPRIIFLTYSMNYNKTNDEYSISLINKMITEGKIKSRDLKSPNPEIDDLEYIIYDANEKIIERNYLSNPLKKTIEYVNSEGELAKEDISLDSVEFFLRLQLAPDTKSIVLQRYGGPDSRNIHLHTTKL
jgi:hypothetical protein